MYALSWYLDIVCGDWCAIVWPSATDYQAIMPIPIKKKWGIDVIQQPLFCQYLGIFCKHPIANKLASDFLSLLSGEFSYVSAYHFNPHNSAQFSGTPALLDGFEIQTLTTHQLALNTSYAQVTERYSADRKMNLKRGVEHNWSVIPGDDITKLIDLFRMNHESKIAGGVNHQAYDMLKKLYEELKCRCETELWYACSGGLACAGILMVRCCGLAIYLFNAANHKGRTGNARSVLLDQYIQRNTGLELILDFESPSIDSIKSFYKSFGAQESNFISINKNGLPFPLKQIQNLRKWFFTNR